VETEDTAKTQDTPETQDTVETEDIADTVEESNGECRNVCQNFVISIL
jgi:hypothetical protein